MTAIRADVPEGPGQGKKEDKKVKEGIGFSERYKGVLTFYEKNGFIPNDELHNKNRKTMKTPRNRSRGVFVGEEIYNTGGVFTPPSNQHEKRPVPVKKNLAVYA